MKKSKQIGTQFLRGKRHEFIFPKLKMPASHMIELSWKCNKSRGVSYGASWYKELVGHLKGIEVVSCKRVFELKIYVN